MYFPVLTLPLFTSIYFFFFNDTATTEIYTLSLHDALPISRAARQGNRAGIFMFSPIWQWFQCRSLLKYFSNDRHRSEEHTSELQSQFHLVCRLLLEKKKKNII